MYSVTVDFYLKKPHPAQQRILDTARRFNHLRCGRRFGKTSLIEELSSISLDGKRVGIWFPTYKDLSEVWADLIKTYSPVIKRKNEQLKEIELLTGGKIDFWSMEDPESGQGRKYHRAIIDEAAKAVGIAASTLILWMKEPAFQTAYREAKRAAFSQVTARLQQGSVVAATALLKTVVDPNTPASVRVRAAECVLNHALRAIEVEDIEARVAELERASAASGTGQPK